MKVKMSQIFYILVLVFTGVSNAPEPYKQDEAELSFEVEDEFSAPKDGSFHEIFRGKERSKKRLKNKESLWPLAAVIYKINESIECPSSWKCQRLARVMTHYEENTCVRFKEWSGESDFVSVIQGSDPLTCGAIFGRYGGEQFMDLADGCWEEGSIIHEFGHTLGFWDEQNRYDRDKWIYILTENLVPEALPLFEKAPKNMMNILGEPFDFASIMMYGSHDFSKDPARLPTILPKQSGVKMETVWKKNSLSAGDVRRINKLYRCEGKFQKPRFPTDITCFFDNNSCGFKGVGTDDQKQPWSWTRKIVGPDRQATGGYLYSDLETAKTADAYTWTINFHALSPTDTKRKRAGCLSFSYVILTDWKASLKVLFTTLKSAHDYEYEGAKTHEIWQETALKTEKAFLQWRRVSIPILVTNPFTVGTTDGSMRLDDFELKYTACANPKGAVSGIDHNKAGRDVPKSQFSQAFARLCAYYRVVFRSRGP